MTDETAADILKRNEWMFAQRRARLEALAYADPERHPPSKRTWWDIVEIERRKRPPDTPAQRRWLDRMWKAMMLAPTIDICEALLRGEKVPPSKLRPEWVERFGFR